MDPYLDADALPFETMNVPLLSEVPAILNESSPSFDDHFFHQLALLHKSRPKRFGARPRLRAPAVQIYPGDMGSHQRGCP